MQGIFIHYQRVKTKAALKRAATISPDFVQLEATSLHGGEYDGRLSEAPDGRYTVVGPNPYTDRRWYAQITKRNGKVVVK